MKQTTRALRALSPKRSHHRPVSGDEESDGPGSPTGASPSFLSLTGRTASGRQRRSRRRRAAAAAAPLPELEKTEEEFKRDWGISREREEILLVEFRRLIEAAVGPLKPVFDRFYLRRFLRARQHDLARAKAMFMAHLQWREQNGIDTILEDFHFEERDAFLSIYPQGYHKTDKLGRPVYIQHIGAIKIKQLAEITTEDRMIRFHIQEYERCLKYIFPSCSKQAGRHIDQTFAIMDVKGVGLKHLTGDVKSILGRITETDQNNYPETLGKTVIINAPTVFKMIWGMVRPMLDVRTQAKIEVAPNDYMKVLLKHIDADSIPDYLGGNSKGSLIDDVGPWKDPAILALVEADIARREKLGSVGEEEGVLSGDSLELSMDLERSGTGSVPPSPLAAAGGAAAQQAVARPNAEAATPAGSTPVSAHAASPPASPFDKCGAGTFPQHSGLTDSEVDEFQDARSRRQSILSTSGSSAYLSAGDDDTDFFTPKHSDGPPVGGSGFSFHSDQPLLAGGASAEASPEGKGAPARGAVAGVAAQPPSAAAQQQQQQQAGVRYSDQYPPSPEQAARRGQRPQLAVALPAASSTEQQSSSGGAEVSLNGGMAQETQFGTPGSVGWSPSKGRHVSSSVPAPPLQIPILARVRALEEKLPDAERHLKRYLPPGGDLPSKAVGEGTLLSRIDALERAMDTLLRAQETALDQQRHRTSAELADSGCCSCCCMM
ncbi:Glutamyl-tRNA(Gln) amidotransferase subunit A [Micractinium conductrix]|uniref:Glutamyl-tRNA(Gln) amidotransferase subunit A n=1 Tax=Micractinium conductrix TaxID=554055 RepID=A0A2P6UZ55_9CHLO|nr:Glutamyl-tRNA(Gln) amidotransferase subunit A [Micractinium conductrix]|eukprot:PSC67121.1 Glutamyl-tRNA(Gln) amidotransferase subunit A [Micractinium conductrix]